jgi:hypothetical protein
MVAIAKDDWTHAIGDPMLCSWALAGRFRRNHMSAHDETPDRRFWTAYDHFMFEREARAMRREYVYALLARFARRIAVRARRIAARVRVELVHAGAQPPRRGAARSASF